LNAAYIGIFSAGQQSNLLGRMSAQITALAEQPAELDDGSFTYRVNQPPPWWKPDDQRCQDTTDRLEDWVQDVYRPVFGYLADLARTLLAAASAVPGLP
jgi:hypothetical protein